MEVERVDAGVSGVQEEGIEEEMETVDKEDSLDDEIDVLGGNQGVSCSILLPTLVGHHPILVALVPSCVCVLRKHHQRETLQKDGENEVWMSVTAGEWFLLFRSA